MGNPQTETLSKVLDLIEEGKGTNAERYMSVIGKAMDTVIAMARQDGHPICNCDGAFEAQVAMWAWVNEQAPLPLERVPADACEA